jgi:hypothetical protein
MTRAQTGWRAGAKHGENSPEDRSFFYLKPSAPRRSSAVCPVRRPFPHIGGSAPAARYTHIDAFRGKTVTRETLLRYTLKSHSVNVLIRGNLLKTHTERDWGSTLSWREKSFSLTPSAASVSYLSGKPARFTYTIHLVWAESIPAESDSVPSSRARRCQPRSGQLL